MKSNLKQGKVSKSTSNIKHVGTHRNVLSQWILAWNIKALALTVQIINKVKVFNEKVKFQGQGHRVKQKGFVTINTHIKYQNSSNHYSKDIHKV